MTPQILSSIHKLLYSVFEQAVLLEYVDRNPFHKAILPKPFLSPTEMLSNEEIKKLLQSSGFSLHGIAVHFAFAGSLLKVEILALTWSDVNFKNDTIFINKMLKRVRKDVTQVLDRNDILYQFPAMIDEGRTVIVLKCPKNRSSNHTFYLPPPRDRSAPKLKKGTGSFWKKAPDFVLRYSLGRTL